MDIEKRVYLICPVRNITEKEKAVLDRYVRILEHKGYKVHYPPRDVNQNDSIGMNICSSHRDAMNWCTEVRAAWNPESQGSVFDFGMTFFSQKPFKLANKRRIENWLKEHPGKSYPNVAYELNKMYNSK